VLNVKKTMQLDVKLMITILKLLHNVLQELLVIIKIMMMKFYFIGNNLNLEWISIPPNLKIITWLWMLLIKHTNVEKMIIYVCLWNSMEHVLLVMKIKVIILIQVINVPDVMYLDVLNVIKLMENVLHAKKVSSC